MALSKTSSDEDMTRFFRLSFVILEELTTILRDLLHKEICPSQIFDKVKQKLKQLPHAQQVLIQNAKIEGFTKFDITLLCTLLRNYCPNIQQPTQSWTMTEMPAQNEMTLGDDIVRIRLIKNKYVSHIHEAAISETEFKELWSIISDICTRMQTRLPNKDYVLRLIKAQYRTIDSGKENLYMDKIKELADEDEKILKFIKEREIPVFAVVTKIDKCDLSQDNLELKKNELCEAINITPDKLLLCSNYQPDPDLDIEKDIDILKFLIKVCSPHLQAVELEKIECEAPPPIPVLAAVYNTIVDERYTYFRVQALKVAVAVLVVAFFLSLIMNLWYKMRSYHN